MGSGKGLCIAGGIITLIAVYITSWMTVIGVTVNGMNFIMRISNIVLNAQMLGMYLGLPQWGGYIILVVGFLILASGVLIIIGASSRASAIIGAIFALLPGLVFILYELNIYTNYGLMQTIIIMFGGTFTLVPGIIPFSYEIAGFHIGSILLVLGGVLGFIGGIIGPSDW